MECVGSNIRARWILPEQRTLVPSRGFAKSLLERWVSWDMSSYLPPTCLRSWRMSLWDILTTCLVSWVLDLGSQPESESFSNDCDASGLVLKGRWKSQIWYILRGDPTYTYDIQ